MLLIDRPQFYDMAEGFRLHLNHTESSKLCVFRHLVKMLPPAPTEVNSKSNLTSGVATDSVLQEPMWWGRGT